MKKESSSFSANQICSIALFMALVCVSTLFFKIPIPLGYAHLGNGFIFLAAVFLGNPGGILCAGIGSALADMFGGWYAWFLPTLIIKSIMGGVVALIAHNKDEKIKLLSAKTVFSIIIGSIIMVSGYFFAGSFLENSFGAGAAQLPGLIGEDIAGILLFYVLGIPLEKSGINNLVQGSH